MARHTILQTMEGINIGIKQVYTPNESDPCVFPSLLTDQLVSDPQPATRPRPFFRLGSNNKQQFCVRFSSGAVQIIASEP